MFTNHNEDRSLVARFTPALAPLVSVLGVRRHRPEEDLWVHSGQQRTGTIDLVDQSRDEPRITVREFDSAISQRSAVSG